MDFAKKIAVKIVKEESRPESNDTAIGFLSKNNPANLPFGTILILRERLRHHVVLPNETENQLLSIEQEYAARERLGKYNLTPQKKILVYGPSGCGKALCAERIAWDLGLPLLKVRFNSFSPFDFKKAVLNLEAIFDYCKKKPVVLLLDECDFGGKSCVSWRGMDNKREIANVLYGLLDEYDAPGLVIAATNFGVEAFDDILRSRFDDVIFISKPQEAERKRLLETTLSAMRVSSDVDIEEISDKLNCCSAAYVISVALRAAKISVLEGGDKICKEHFTQALEEIS